MNFALAALLMTAQPSVSSEDPLVDVPCAFMPAFFDVGSAELRPQAQSYLLTGYYQDFEVYRPSSRARFTLTSYTSDAGSDRANARLAARREAAVRRFLIARGIPRKRIRSGTVREEYQEPMAGRGVMIEVEVRRSVLMRIMPPGGPIC